MIEALVGFAAFLALAFLRVPMAFAMGIVGFVGFAYKVNFNAAAAMIGQTTYETGLAYTLSVIPLFILMGALAERGGLARDLFTAANALIGHRPGGMGWVEQEIRRPIETWRRQEEERCRKEECVWLCLCCNKWICTIVTVLVRVIEWVVEIVGEWLVETICKIIVTIIRVIVMIIIEIVKWVVIAVVCIFEALCRALIVLAALAILLSLLCLAAIPIPLLAPALLPLAR